MKHIARHKHELADTTSIIDIWQYDNINERIDYIETITENSNAYNFILTQLNYNDIETVERYITPQGNFLIVETNI